MGEISYTPPNDFCHIWCMIDIVLCENILKYIAHYYTAGLYSQFMSLILHRITHFAFLHSITFSYSKDICFPRSEHHGKLFSYYVYLF